MKHFCIQQLFVSLCLGWLATVAGQAVAVRYDVSKASRLNNCKAIVNGRGNAGSSGEGYLDYGGRGAWFEVTVNVPLTGLYDIDMRYSSQSTRPLDVTVDGTKQASYKVSKTNSWTSWTNESVRITLQKGSRKIRFLASASTGPNVDWISIGTSSGQAPAPAPSPVPPPPANGSPSNPKSAIVLGPNKNLGRGQFVSSPSKTYKVGLTSAGSFELQDNRSRVIWSAGVRGGDRLYLQSDGNLLVRNGSNKVIWTTNTSRNAGATFTLDDGGRIAVVKGVTPLWMDGIPRGQYTKAGSRDLQFPIRGTFYYAWYPATWTVNGALAKFKPDLGYYSSGDPKVAEAHVDDLDYAHFDLSIVSWWDADGLDRARINLLMEKTLEASSNLKWSVYHEREREDDASAAAIREDLDYLKEWFAWHPTWAHIDGKPVIFVYNEGNRGSCEVAKRWMDASNDEWYVVLKLFPNFRDCPTQPDSWHQYGPASTVLQYDNVSFGISPGFWRADRNKPDLVRVNKATWCRNVEAMVDSGEPWQLVTTFNEAGEGTMIEPSTSWPSKSGYGDFLDCLHDYV